ncbi:S-adenosyl-L-methionine-dependent methyltransferase [Trametes cingulata]|nr:S-adenosyl-L-methionine-dependent methyltransferase [Trametes cingulata]
MECRSHGYAPIVATKPQKAVQRKSEDDDWSSYAFDGDAAIDPYEIHNYFREQGGRLFHSHPSAQYPLPVDAEEQQRQNALHELLRGLIGDRSVAPVPKLLAFTPGRQKTVVDLGTGTGKWVLDMAREFPHVRFFGVDIVPIATPSPPPNVRFEIHNIMRPLRYGSGTIDMVHARSLDMAVCDYHALAQEAGRILRPGGLFLSCEFGRHPVMKDGSHARVHAPNAYAFYDAVHEALRTRCGISWVAEGIPGVLEESNLFTDIEARCFHVPIGDGESVRTDLGGVFRELMVIYTRSMRTLLSKNRHDDVVDALIEGCIHDLRRVSGMNFVCYIVHARRA